MDTQMMQAARKTSSVLRNLLTAVPATVRSALPNLLLFGMFVVVIAWHATSLVHARWTEQVMVMTSKPGLFLYFDNSSVTYLLSDSWRWLLGIPSLIALAVIDFVLIARFARGWRRRRWGRKPPEIERATRYFMG